jgi:hypothetical protein
LIKGVEDMRHLGVCLAIITAAWGAAAQGSASSAFGIARVKYAGGGDWYNDPSAEVNLLTFLRTATGMEVDARYRFVEIGADEFFSHPFLFLTGHGNILLTESEVRRLRTHLENGGFLYVDDDYGLDKAFRRELKRVFPAAELVELPFDHGIYRALFPFPEGPPKTHEHDAKPPRGYGLFHNGRMVVYYTVESNPSDGWADADVHNDPEAKRQEALRFGANIVLWALTQ